MNIKLFNARFDKIIIRYYLMMIVIIGSFYLGAPILGLIGLPIFLSAILGMEFKSKNRKAKVHYPNLEKSDLGRIAA